jgi:bifunctional polynucleotide phosphatase/kinase
MWSHKETCVYKLSEIKDKPCIGFDFDNTLVQLRTSDILPNVKERLTRYYADYNIIIFSNQKGIQKGKQTHEVLQGIFDLFVKKVQLPLSIFYSTSSDMYRKPCTGMYRLFTHIFKKPLEWYCGDACGRQGDFSNSDLYFANNCGIPFKTPEHIFQSQSNSIKVVKCSELYKEDEWIDGINRNKQSFIQVNDIDIQLPTDKKLLLLMVGAQGSGKSLMADRLSKKYKYTVLSSDNIPSKSKMKRTIREIVQSDTISGIIIDNTNATIKNRDEWFQCIDDTWLKCIIYINIPKALSFHFVKNREMYINKHIPDVAVHSFYKRLEPPTQNEAHVIQLNRPILFQDFNSSLRFT